MMKKFLTISAISCLTLANCFAIQACRDCEDDRGQHLITRGCPCEKNKSASEGAVASSESTSDKEALLCSSSSSKSSSSSEAEEVFATSNSDNQSSSNNSVV